MARFNDGERHLEPREAVERAISRINPQSLSAIAAERTQRRLTPEFDARELAFAVPTESLALALDIDAGELASVLSDTEDVVRSIGRGESASTETDLATDRLTSLLASHPDGAVAAISLLYQVFDSAAALFSVSLIAERSDQPRRNALAKTVRRSTGNATIGSASIQPDTSVTVSLEGDGIEFGAGRHHCPGEELAHAIVDGMLSALIEIELESNDVEVSADGRPTKLPMRSR